MLLWINGPFGGGKTQTAFELARRLPKSLVCDPECVGFGLQRMAPPMLQPDFQNFRSWRHGVHEVLDLALRKHDGAVIAPMTLIEPDYFREIVGRLRADGHDVRHVALLAERNVVLRRLRQRSLGLSPQRSESFAVSTLDSCLHRLHEPEFATQIRTDHLPIPQVAEHVAAAAELTLAPNNDSALRGHLRRAWTNIKHIRFA